MSELIRSAAPRIELNAATTAWQGEQTETLRRRAALVFLLLAALLTVLVLLDIFVLHAGAIVKSGVSGWYWPLEWFVPASLALAGFVVLRWPDTTSRIEAFVCAVLVANIAVSAWSDAAFLAGSAPTRTNGLVLFIAAVLPWRVRYQAIAAATAALAYPVFVLVAQSAIPEVAASWAQVSEASRDRAVQGAISGALVAGASVVVTHVLYSVRTELRKAQKLGNYVIDRDLGKYLPHLRLRRVDEQAHERNERRERLHDHAGLGRGNGPRAGRIKHQTDGVGAQSGSFTGVLCSGQTANFNSGSRHLSEFPCKANAVG